MSTRQTPPPPIAAGFDLDAVNGTIAMNDKVPDSKKASPVIAIFAMLVLGGLLIVPLAFIFYGAGGALGGLMLLAILISCQSGVYVIARLVWRRLS